MEGFNFLMRKAEIERLTNAINPLAADLQRRNFELNFVRNQARTEEQQEAVEEEIRNLELESENQLQQLRPLLAQLAQLQTRYHVRYIGYWTIADRSNGIGDMVAVYLNLISNIEINTEHQSPDRRNFFVRALFDEIEQIIKLQGYLACDITLVVKLQ